MKDNLRHFHEPPRILEGGALLFWGGVTGHPVIGLLCALLVEARSWTALRWKFGERGFVRAWYLSIGMGLVASVWVWLESASPIFLFEACKHSGVPLQRPLCICFEINFTFNYLKLKRS